MRSDALTDLLLVATILAALVSLPKIVSDIRSWPPVVNGNLVHPARPEHMKQLDWPELLR